MLDDFAPIVHVIKGRTIKVWTVADVHIGSNECQLEAFRAFLRRVMDDDDSFIVCCGDLINNCIKDSVTNVYDETMPPSAQIQLAADLLRPLAQHGKILGIFDGNHDARSAKSVKMDQGYTIFCLAGCLELYRQRMAFVRVRLVRGSNTDTYNIMLVHGKTANKRKQFSYVVEGIDAIVAGHTHIGEISTVATSRSRLLSQLPTRVGSAGKDLLLPRYRQEGS